MPIEIHNRTSYLMTIVMFLLAVTVYEMFKTGICMTLTSDLLEGTKCRGAEGTRGTTVYLTCTP